MSMNDPIQRAVSRRTLLRGAAGVAGVACASGPLAVLAQAAAPVEGKQYRLIKPAQATEAEPGKIEVLEFFWYGCPHCNTLEPSLKKWVAKLPADVMFRRVHVPFGDRRHQQLFYTLDAMGKAEEVGDHVFRAIHVDRNRLDTVDLMVALLSKHGIDEKQFRDTFDSFAVRTKMRRAAQIVDAYGVDGVPAMAVNGKYYTSPSMVGSSSGALDVLDKLIAIERKPAG